MAPWHPVILSDYIRWVNRNEPYSYIALLDVMWATHAGTYTQTALDLNKKSTEGYTFLYSSFQHSLKPNHIQRHDDVIKWNHFLRYWPFVWGIHRSAVNSPHKGQWGGTLRFSLICAWTNGWANNREAGDFIRHRPHYNVTVMHWYMLDLASIRRFPREC